MREQVRDGELRAKSSKLRDAGGAYRLLFGGNMNPKVKHQVARRASRAAVLAAVFFAAVATAGADVNYYMEHLTKETPQTTETDLSAMPPWLQKQGQSSTMRFENRKQAIELMYADHATINADFLRVYPYTQPPGVPVPGAPFGRELYPRLHLALVGDTARSFPRVPLNFINGAEYDRFRAELRVVLQRALTRAMTPVLAGGYGVTEADLLATAPPALAGAALAAFNAAALRDQSARKFTIVKQMGTATGFYSGNPSKLVGHYFERKRAARDAANAALVPPVAPVQCSYDFKYTWVPPVGAQRTDKRTFRAAGAIGGGNLPIAQAGGGTPAAFECSDADYKIYSPILAIGLMKHHGIVAGAPPAGPGPEINIAAVDGDAFHVFKAMGTQNPPRGFLEAYPEIRAFQEYWSLYLGKEVDFKLEMSVNLESDYEWAGSNITVAREASAWAAPGAGGAPVLLAGGTVAIVDAFANGVMNALIATVRGAGPGFVPVAAAPGAATAVPVFPPVMSALVAGAQPPGTVPLGAPGGVADIPETTTRAHGARVAAIYGW